MKVIIIYVNKKATAAVINHTLKMKQKQNFWRDKLQTKTKIRS